MTIKGHIVLSNNILIGIVLCTISKYGDLYNSFTILNYLQFYIFFIFGTIFVDIDEPNSYIGRKLFFISIPFKIFNVLAKLFLLPLSLFGIKLKNINRFFEHRGITHILLTPLIIALISYGVLGYSESISLSMLFFSFGILTHHIGDLITNTGIKSYLFPILIGKNIKIIPNTFNTNSTIEYVFNLLLSVTLIVQLYFLYLLIY